MKIPEGSIIVIDSIFNNAVVGIRAYKVLKEMPKSVDIVAMEFDGTVLEDRNPKTIRKSSIVAILSSIDDFEKFKLMNDQLEQKHNELSELTKRLELKVNQIKTQTQKDIKAT